MKHISELLPKEKLVLFFLVILASTIPFFLYLGSKKLIVILFAVPVVTLFYFNFENYFRLFLIYSIFLGYYFNVDLRIQLINLIAYLLIFYYFFNKDSTQFNKYKVPFPFKIVALILTVAVFLSSYISPFSSIIGFYYFFMFTVYILTGYIVFRSLNTYEMVEFVLKHFAYAVAIYGCLIIGQILLTGVLRSNGISGPTIPDMITIALLIILFRYFILHNEYSTGIVICAFILTVVLITTLSRFAWIGFLSSFVYGILISIIYHLNRKEFFTKRIRYFLGAAVVLILVIISSGLHRVVLNRFADVDISVLDNSRDEGAVSNSLDTRALVWVTALNAFLNNKWFGVGYFMFHKVSFKYNVLPENLYITFVEGLDPHSTFLGFLTETGIIGFIFILFYFTLAFYYSFKALKISETETSRNISIILNILIFFMFTTSIYSGAFTFGYNGFVLHIIIWLAVGNYVLLNSNFIESKSAKN